jgi:hypothetical protein
MTPVNTPRSHLRRGWRRLGVVAAPWLYLTLRFSLVGADRPTERRAMLDRFRQQFSNRRKAAADKGKGSGA